MKNNNTNKNIIEQEESQLRKIKNKEKSIKRRLEILKTQQRQQRQIELDR